uniref:THAP domain-containing protein 5 n=1 Tax=Sphenodon punctatus TaxID=8508 RepID=A0A8D0H1T4_SPHPU
MVPFGGRVPSRPGACPRHAPLLRGVLLQEPGRFPLHDKERLEKWLRNMKRDTWTPSKHQLLCSDHFTPDSLDVRWGIRYLKHTAIPTIFSLPDDQEKDPSQNKTQEIKTEDDDEEEEEVSVIGESVNVSTALEPYSPKEKVTVESLDEKPKTINPSTLNKAPQNTHLQNTNSQEDTTALTNSPERHFQQTSPGLIAAALQNVETSNFHTSVENLVNCASTVLQSTDLDFNTSIENHISCTTTVLQTTNSEYLDSSLEFKNSVGPVTDQPTENLNSHITECSVEVQPASENAVLLRTITQTLEQLNGNEESVITIILPAECSKEPLLVGSSFMPAEQEFINVEEIEDGKPAYMTSFGANEILQTEHSYCRQDVDKEQLWQKITKLHSKITCLEIQERKTLGRLKSLEALIGQLKQENLLSEEKLKIVENCFTTFEVTMIQ